MASAPLLVDERYARTDDGWSICLRRTLVPERHDPTLEPLLIVPGYGMNSFIFSFHPRGTSMERWFAEAGFEVWAADLRGQGLSRPRSRRSGAVSLEAYARFDVPAALRRIAQDTRSEQPRVHLIGCSLGGSTVYTYLALHDAPPVQSVVTMGAPLEWREAHPLLKVAFGSPRLVGAIPFRGTRTLVRKGFPLLRRVPPLLGLYMNPETIDLSAMPTMTQTVEDPDRHINRDIAAWVRRRHLLAGGENVSEAMARQAFPLLVVLSNRDGIVPPATARSVVEYWGGDDVETMTVGTDSNWYAHANLFIADDAPTLVFEPLIAWLKVRGAASRP